MTPVLLDQRSLFRAGLTVSVTMLGVFFTGYYVGQQRAESPGSMVLNKTIALALPRPAHADTAEYEPLIPRAQMPGAYIDVDSPDATAAGISSKQQVDTQVHSAGTELESVIHETASITEKSAASDASTEQDGQPLQLASLAITPDVIKTGYEAVVIDRAGEKSIIVGDDQHPSSSDESGHQTDILDTANAEDARYTIQVGVFADTENAIRRMSELESQDLSAYTDGYTNKRNQLRFNVRFGYYKDKSSALAALSSFQQNMPGSAYVARIRRN